MSRLLQRSRFLHQIHYSLKYSHTSQPRNALFTCSSIKPQLALNRTQPAQSQYFRSFCSTPNSAESHSSSRTSTNTLASSTASQTLTREVLQRSFRRWTRWFTIRMLLFVGMIVGAAIYCWDHPNEIINLKTKLSKIFSDVGSQTLNQKELQIQATNYSKQMIKDVFNDHSMQQETKQFFIRILSQQDFLDTISVLLQDLFQRDIMIDSVKALVINVFNDPVVIEQCKVLVGHAISADENKQLLLKTLHDILDDQELTDHARDLANHTVKGVLDDEDIKRLSAVFLQHVLEDDTVQQSSSDSLYKILVGALTPTLFKKKNNDMLEHVQHHHIDVESIEMDLHKGTTMKDEQEGMIENAQELLVHNVQEEGAMKEQEKEINDHANQISSVIGDINQ